MPLRSLVCTPTLPLPIRQGFDLRVLQNVAALAAHGPVSVFALGTTDAGAEPPAGVHRWAVTTDPEPARTRAGGEALAWLRRPGGSPYDQYHSTVVATELSAMIAELRPHVVVVEDLAFLPHLDVLTAARSRLVLDLHNVLPDLYRQLATPAVAGNAAEAMVYRRLVAASQRDLAGALARAGAVWVTSALDADRLRAGFDVRLPVHVVPNTVDVERWPFVPAPRPGRTLVFPGLMRYAPNARAAEFLATAVLPHLPDRRLVVVGDQPAAAVRTLAERPGVTVTGRVLDVRPYLAEAAAMPVALFAGSGTRYKILEAWAAGCPVVSTALGFEGLAAVPGTHLLAAETADDFVAALRRLEDEPDLAAHIARTARDLVETHYSWPAAARAITATLAG